MSNLQTRLDKATDQALAQVKADKEALGADMVIWFKSLPYELQKAFERFYSTSTDKQPGDDDLIATAWAAFPRDLEQRGEALDRQMQSLGLEWGEG